MGKSSAEKALRAVGLGVLVTTFCSCLLFEPRGARDLYVVPGGEEVLRQSGWAVGSVRVEKSVGPSSLEEEARSILRLILARDFRPGDSGAAALNLDAIIREREFVRDYRTLNAVSVELCLYESQPGEPLAVALYSENTRDTIESHAYLHDVIRRALRLFRR